MCFGAILIENRSVFMFKSKINRTNSLSVFVRFIVSFTKEHTNTLNLLGLMYYLNNSFIILKLIYIIQYRIYLVKLLIGLLFAITSN